MTFLEALYGSQYREISERGKDGAKGRFNGEAVNVSSGTETSIKEATEIFAAAIDEEIKISFNKKTKPGDPLNWKADISIIQNWGFESKVSIETGLKNTVKWLKENT